MFLIDESSTRCAVAVTYKLARACKERIGARLREGGWRSQHGQDGDHDHRPAAGEGMHVDQDTRRGAADAHMARTREMTI